MCCVLRVCERVRPMVMGIGAVVVVLFSYGANREALRQAEAILMHPW